MSGVRSGSVAGVCHTTDGRRRGRLYRIVGGFHDLVVRLQGWVYRVETGPGHCGSLRLLPAGLGGPSVDHAVLYLKLPERVFEAQSAAFGSFSVVAILAPRVIVVQGLPSDFKRIKAPIAPGTGSG